MPNPNDMPTVARIRERLNSLGSEDITIPQAVWVFGVSTPSPVRDRINRGELSAVKMLGEWRIDVKSVHKYLDKINSQFKKA